EGHLRGHGAGQVHSARAVMPSSRLIRSGGALTAVR
ncbi:MAG: hypothetical protein JWM84_2971, partial [Nocardioides sp.]|nr:hypothetical protein [Nocardioides sp.]